jgi:beta-glucosidase
MKLIPYLDAERCSVILNFKKSMSQLCRLSGAEGCVLLKNDGVLPLGRNAPVAVFGVGQIRWFDMGYGSGGDVVTPYKVNLLDGLKSCDAITPDPELASAYRKWCEAQPPASTDWGKWPRFNEEMPLERALVEKAASRCGTALVVLGRSIGESIDMSPDKGGYYLTDGENALLEIVTAAFQRVVVILNISSIIDMSWTGRYGTSAVLVAWQGGMESGNAVADVLCGNVNPCGKLADTIACRYEDYPTASNFGNDDFTAYEEDIFVGYRYFSTFAKERILYPFGFGLSYTSFEITCVSFENMKATVRVTNTGGIPGKEVVQMYCAAPQGRLGKAALQLCGFAKTKRLAPGESQDLTLETGGYMLSSYDDAGKTGYRSAYVLEAGDYVFHIGNSSNNLREAGTFHQGSTKLVLQLGEACAPAEPMERMTAWGKESVPLRTVDLKKRILGSLPPEIAYTGDKGYKLADVKNGKIALDEFIAQLTDEELEALTRGEGAMDSTLGPPGNAGAFGGVVPSLRDKGIPPAVTTDGPSGIRLKAACSLTPCATALACTWDPALIEELSAMIGDELISNGSSILLGPGMNIHRNPLCGRNFEYYSEDPLLSGKMAAAAVRGIQSKGISACPKHFCCNNQEWMRTQNDSRVSERALREIYLKGFEICVKEAGPLNLMTSYNRLNGVWNHYNYELVTVILRGEWGYKGNVMTDWWLVQAGSPEFSGMRTHAYRVRAQVDVFMPGNHDREDKDYHSDGTLLETLGRPDGITRGELQRTARNVLNFIRTQID